MSCSRIQILVSVRNKKTEQCNGEYAIKYQYKTKETRTSISYYLFTSEHGSGNNTKLNIGMF